MLRTERRAAVVAVVVGVVALAAGAGVPEPSPAQQPPRRLVELNHVDLPPEHVHERPRSSMSVLSDRRSSSGSVRDLVKGFETLEQQQAREMAEERTKLKRVRSVGEWAATAGPGAAARTQQQGKRAWR